MSWIRMTMKYPGKCIACGKSIRVGEQGLWSKGIGVKHADCAENIQMTCSVCGGPAGCPECEFRDGCDIPHVSPACICKSCSEKKDALETYRRSVGRKFFMLSGSV